VAFTFKEGEEEEEEKEEADGKHSIACCLVLSGFLLGLPFDTDQMEAVRSSETLVDFCRTS
jgi:hypothetical protein